MKSKQLFGPSCMYTDHQFKTRCNEGTPVLNSHVDISRTQMDSVSTGSISTLLLPLLKLLLTPGARKSESWTPLLQSTSGISFVVPHSMNIDFTFSVEFTGKCTRTSFSFNFAAVGKNVFHCITCKLFYSLKCVTMQLSPMHVALKTLCPLLK